MAAKKPPLLSVVGSQQDLGDPITDVSWVSKLKEHYDRLGKSEAVLDSKYKLKTAADGGYVCRIYVPELGREVEEEVRSYKSKKEAKQNAAKKALLSLPKRT